MAFKQFFLGLLAVSGSVFEYVSAQACTPQNVHKTLSFEEFHHFAGPPRPRLLQSWPLIGPPTGSGWSYIEGSVNGPSAQLYRPILFENDQGWSLINCSWTEDPPTAVQRRGGCTSGTIALLSSSPSSNYGKIGTLKKYPSVTGNPGWAIYDLLSFRLTPVIYDAALVNKKVSAEVYGWKVDGTKTAVFTTSFVGNGFKVVMPKDWKGIVQWQVKTFYTSGATRVEFEFMIDELELIEYNVLPVDCPAPTIAPLPPAPPAEKISFDDLKTAPNCKPPFTAVPQPYKDLTFTSPTTSTFNITSTNCLPANSKNAAKSPPNALYASNPLSIATATQTYLYDFDSLWLTLNPRSGLALSNITITLTATRACSDYRSTSYLQLTPTTSSSSLEIKINPTEPWKNFRKVMSLEISVKETGTETDVGFWMDDFVIRRRAGEGLPGCVRCGRVQLDWCESPGVVRPENLAS